MSTFRNNRVHPQSCRCRGCRKKKKEAKIESKAVIYTVYFLFFLLLAIA